MSSFLTDEWFAQVERLEREYQDVPIPPELAGIDVSVTVVGGPRGAAACHLAPAPGGLAVRRGERPEAEVRRRVPWEVAVAMFVDHDLSVAMQAFSDGAIHVEGDMSKLLALEQAAPTTRWHPSSSNGFERPRTRARGPERTEAPSGPRSPTRARTSGPGTRPLGTAGADGRTSC